MSVPFIHYHYLFHSVQSLLIKQWNKGRVIEECAKSYQNASKLIGLHFDSKAKHTSKKKSKVHKSFPVFVFMLNFDF